jgi:hypothetical protein
MAGCSRSISRACSQPATGRQYSVFENTANDEEEGKKLCRSEASTTWSPLHYLAHERATTSNILLTHRPIAPLPKYIINPDLFPFRGFTSLSTFVGDEKVGFKASSQRALQSPMSSIVVARPIVLVGEPELCELFLVGDVSGFRLLGSCSTVPQICRVRRLNTAHTSRAWSTFLRRRGRSEPLPHLGSRGALTSISGLLVFGRC